MAILVGMGKGIANAHANAPTLTTPCSLQALRDWLNSVDVMAPGSETSVTVTTTATSITVA